MIEANEEFPDFPVVDNRIVAEPWTEQQDAAFKAWLLENYWSGPRWFKHRFAFELACGRYLPEGHPDKRPCDFKYYAEVKKTRFLRVGNIYDYEDSYAL